MLFGRGAVGHSEDGDARTNPWQSVACRQHPTPRARRQDPRRSEGRQGRRRQGRRLKTHLRPRTVAHGGGPVLATHTAVVLQQGPPRCNKDNRQDHPPGNEPPPGKLGGQSAAASAWDWTAAGRHPPARL